MKKTVCLLAFFVLLSLVFCFGDENNNQKSGGGKFDLGAGFTYANNPRLLGGHFEFGIELYSSSVYIQNRFLLRAGGFKADGIGSTVLTLSEKLVLGRRSFFDLYGIYLYIEGGAGTYGNATKGFFDNSLAYSFGFGGGAQLMMNSRGLDGLYVEAGYLAQKMATNFPLGGVLLHTGWRIHL